MTGATAAIESPARPPLVPASPVSKPGKRLELFRRQLAAAFGPADGRHSRLRASLRFHRSEPQDDSSAGEQADGFRARSLESRHERFVAPVSSRRLLKTAPTRLFCSTAGSDHKTRSPKHLIRMFAERRETAPLECQNIVGHLFDAAAPRSAASKFAAKTLDSATTNDHNSNNGQSTPIDHDPFCRVARPAKIRNQVVKSCSCEQLMRILDELERERCATSGISQEFALDLELVRERTRQAAGRWADCDPLRLQQEAILELLATELNYIRRLGVISELFLGALEQIRAQSSGALLGDIEPEQLASNAKSILDAHRALWLRHFRPLVGSSNTLLEPSELSCAFANMCRTFAPYYGFCTQQASCIARIKSLCATSETFGAYLRWCESRPECTRERLIDLLALPMQRLTRYPLLLRTILKRTDPAASRDQCEALVQTIALTDRFVHTVDLEMKRREDFSKLCDISERLVAIQVAAAEATPGRDHSNHDYNYHNQEVRTILRAHLANFNAQTLMLSLFECPHACHRQLIFDSSAASNGAMPIKFKDAQNTSRLDVIILILTDQLLVCKQVQPRQSSRWHARAAASNSESKSIFNRQHQLQSHYASSSANSDQLQVPSSFEQPAPPSDDAQRRPVFMRQRAASHSFERRAPNDDVTGGEQRQQRRRRRQKQNIVTADDLNFLSPARALIKVSSEQTLVWAGSSSGAGTAATTHHRRRLSMSVCETPTASSPNDGRRANNQSRSVSNCSLVSDSNFEFSWPASGPASELNPLVTPPVSPQRRLQHQSNSLTTGQPTTTGNNRVRRESRRAEMKPPVKLRLVQSPYPIERLVAHELGDRRSVLICLVNDTQTVANSFVLLFPKQSCDPASSNLKTSPARRLIALIEEAQKRYSAVAQLHGRHTKPIQTTSTPPGDNQQQPSCSSSIESNSPARRTSHNSRVATQVDESPRLIAEQHQLFMLSHGRHEELATTEFTYELARDPARDFRVVARPLAGDHLFPATCSPSSHSTQGQWASARWGLRARPQLGQSNRVLNEQQSADARSANSASPSLESDAEYANDTSRLNNLLAFGRSNDSERDVKSICSQSASIETSDRQAGSTRSAGVSRQASQRTNASGRKHLSSLRRQNVVLSVSCEQQQPEPTRVVADQDSLDRRLLHTQFVAAQSPQRRRPPPPRTVDSSSIDSAVGGAATDTSFGRRSRQSFVSRRYESSSVQTTTIDQTFDEATCDLAAEQADELSRLLAVRGREMSANLSRLQSIRSVSTDQTSSPIAVTLTVPSWCEPAKLEEPVVGVGVAAASSNGQRSSIGVHTDEPNDGLLSGCLDVRTLKFRDRLRKPTCGASPRSGGKVKSRLSALINHLHLRHYVRLFY